MKSSSPLLRVIRLCLLTLLVLCPCLHPGLAATITWTNTAGGNWNTAANWSPNTVPGAADTAVINAAGTYAVAVHSGTSVNALVLGGSGSSPTLRLESAGGSFNTTLTVANGFTNQGTIELTCTNGAAITTLNVTAGSLVNDTTGIIRSLEGTGNFARTLGAQLDNRGLVDIQTATTLSRVSADHTNSGTINLSGGNLTLTQLGTTPTFTTTGTITIPAGRTNDVSGGVFNYAGGSWGGGGVIDLTTLTLALTANLTNDTSGLRFQNVTVNGPGRLINAAGRTLALNNSTDVNAPLDNLGELVIHNANTIDGPLTAPASSVIRLEAAGGAFNTTLTVANGFTNQGTIELTCTNGAAITTLNVTAGSLVNDTTGIIRSLEGTGNFARTLGAQLDNRGLVDIQTDTTLSRASADHTNSGTINLSGGNLTLTQLGTTPTFTTTGTITIPAGRTNDLSGGTFSYAGGSWGGGGVIDLTSMTLDLTANLTNDTSGLRFQNVTVNGPGRLINGAGRTLRLFNSTDVNAPLDNLGELVVHSGNTIDGPLTTTASSVIRLESAGGLFNTTLTVANGFTNQGTIELTCTNGAALTTVNVTAGSLVNDTTGIIRSLEGTGSFARTLGAQLDNRGLVDIQTDTTLSRVSADHTNSGTINLSGGNLTLTQSGTSPTFTTTGTITIPAGRTNDVNSGTFNYAGGSWGGGGVIDLTTLTLALTPNLTNDTTGLRFNNVTVNGPGRLINGAGRTLALNNSTDVNAPLDNLGELVIHNVNTIDGPLTAPASSVIRLESAGGSFNTTLTVANGFTNQGTIELTCTNGAAIATLNVTAGSLVNEITGILRILEGTGSAGRTLGLQLDNRGLVDIQTDTTLSRVSADHTNSGTINLSGGNLTLTQSGTTPTFRTTGTILVPAGRTNDLNGGTFNYAGGSWGGGGVIDLTTLTLALTANLTNDTSGLRFQNVTVNGPGRLINAAGRTLALNNSTDVNAPLDNLGGLVIHNANTIDGPLTAPASSVIRLESAGGSFNTTLTVANGFTNLGTIELTCTNGAAITTLNVTAGSLVNDTTGIIRSLEGTGNFARTLGAQLDNRGLVDIQTDTTLSRSGADHTNSGTINLSGGNLTLTQSGTTPSFNNNGIIDISPTRVFDVSSGTFTNAAPGTIKGTGTNDVSGTSFVNNGTIAPGASAGVLTLTGPLPQGTTGVLEVELGGLTVGSQHDQLVVSGAATLTGTLRASLINGFVPVKDDAFVVLTFASRTNTFATVDPPLTNRIGWGVLYTSTNAVLVVSNTAPTLSLSLTDTNINEEVAWTVSASATDNDLPPQTLTYSLVNPPAGASIDPNTGALSWTPTEAQGPGTNTVTVRVTDNGTPSLTDTKTFTVIVNEVNRAPVLNVANQTANELTVDQHLRGRHRCRSAGQSADV